MRFAPPRSKRDRARIAATGSDDEQALRSSLPSLVAQLEEAAAATQEGGVPEPPLDRPRPDSPIAGVPPLLIVD